MRLLTNSRISTFQKCQHADWIQYQLKVRRTGVIPLRIGTEVHECLDLLKQGKDLDDVLHALATRYLWQVDAAQPWEKDRLVAEHVVVETMVKGWEWYWRNSGVKVLATEQVFEIPIRNPKTGRSSRTFKYGGKLDGIVEMPDGELCIMEHKTTSRNIDERGDYWTALTMNSQVTLYLLAARKMGYEVTGILYDVLKVPKQEPSLVPSLDGEGLKQVVDAAGNRVFLDNGKPRQSADKAQGWAMLTRRENAEEYGARMAALVAGAPQDYFKRIMVPRLESDLRSMQEDLWHVAVDVRRSEALGIHPRSRNHCLLYGACPNLPFCAEGEDPEVDPLPASFVRLEVEHPELGDPEDA